MVEVSDPKLEKFSKHIVCLTFVDCDFNNMPEKPSGFTISAFVISVQGIWFIVTAGHVLKLIEDRLKCGHRLLQSRISDNLCAGNTFPPIPFEFQAARKCYVDKDGLDCGIICLRELYVEQLKAGGVVPLTKEACEDIPSDTVEYYMLGFPIDIMTITTAPNKVNFNMYCPLLSIQRISDPPKELQLKHDRFYARVSVATGQIGDKEIKIGNIEGMSGGPIFTTKKIDNNEWQYWLVAIQSSWLKNDRILAACYAKPLFDALDRIINERRSRNHSRS